MGRAENIEAEFPTGTTMPPDLRRLCDYLDRTDYPLSGFTRLRPEGEVLKLWFGDPEAARRFAGFGAGSDGSILAFWLYRGPNALAAPVIHLGSEGENNFVLASDFREFLHLLGIGYDELGFDDLDSPPVNPDSAKRLRTWLLTEFGITPPETGGELVRRARTRHPDLESWIREWQQQREATDRGGTGDGS
jgi:hypothetical protein